MFLLRQRQEQSCQDSPPHAFRKVTFRETLFPPNPKHTALFFPGAGPEKWVFTWEGSRTLPEATVTLLGRGYSLPPGKNSGSCQTMTSPRSDSETHTHCHTVIGSVIRTDVLVCQYMWCRFSTPLLVRFYFPDGWGFSLRFIESRKWPLGTARSCSLKGKPASCVLSALQEGLNSAWGAEQHPHSTHL